ncbi:hypothetical protein ACQCSX_22120 (plasmid) [Pseudarthrobacter sp. P1]|uniref:hypothetical protein n=1 Tax=Pseudarthrobacter sp. P1 TaxID=3418418 RepID=UPI003CF9D3E5
MTAARQPAGIPAGGQFAATTHGESVLALGAGPGYDPEKVLAGILEEAHRSPLGSMGKFYWDTKNAFRSGSTTPEEVMGVLEGANHGGRCARHADDPSQSSPERHCADCHLCVMVQARTRPAPAPVSYGVAPGRPQRHHLTAGTSTTDYDDDDEAVSTTTTVMAGDEKFAAAIRHLFRAPADAEVTVSKTEWEDNSQYTAESSTEIIITCDGLPATYADMGSLMRDLDRSTLPDPLEMAMRFMQASDAPRPLLHGMAAVYLDRGEYSAPEPVFGKILNVFSRDPRPFIEFMHRDGRKEYLKLDRIAAILETDQSGIYNES